jgi:hypothetical protein
MSSVRSPRPTPTRPTRFARRIRIAIVDFQRDIRAMTGFFAHAAIAGILKSG